MNTFFLTHPVQKNTEVFVHHKVECRLLHENMSSISLVFRKNNCISILSDRFNITLYLKTCYFLLSLKHSLTSIDKKLH